MYSNWSGLLFEGGEGGGRAITFKVWQHEATIRGRRLIKEIQGNTVHISLKLSMNLPSSVYAYYTAITILLSMAAGTAWAKGQWPHYYLYSLLPRCYGWLSGSFQTDTAMQP